MFFTGTDMFEGDGDAATFHAIIKSHGNGQVVVKTYATSGWTAKRPYILSYYCATDDNIPWFSPIPSGVGAVGLVGVASGAIASGCVGWVTVRGTVIDASAPASVDFTGSIGDAVFYTDTSGMGASSSAYLGAAHQIGFLIEDLAAGATNVVNIFLTGNECTEAM